MTVQTNTNVANFLGNGAATYPIGFKFNSAADLVVQKTVISTGATTTLTLNSDYSVAGAGVEEGGSITFSQAPTSAESIKVTRVVDLLQLTDLRNQGKFYAEVHEEVFDKLVMIDQQQQTEIDDANAKSDEAVATANSANAKSDQAVAKAAQNLVDMQAQYDAFEQGASLVVIGDYAAGLVVDAYNKVFRKGGEFYRAAAGLDLPYTLTGNWATESVKFVSVGDDVLRQGLALDDGADLVGYKGRTLFDRFDGVINIKDAPFSVRGDNTNQDHANLVACLDFAAAQGKPVIVPTGLYQFNNWIPLPDKLIMVFEPGARWQLTATTVLGGFICGGYTIDLVRRPFTDVEIHGIDLDCSDLPNENGFNAINAVNVKIYNPKVRNVKFSTVNQGGKAFQFEGDVVDGVHVYSPYIENCTIGINSHADPSGAAEVARFITYYNVVMRNVDVPFNCDGQFANPENGTVSNMSTTVIGVNLFDCGKLTYPGNSGALGGGIVCGDRGFGLKISGLRLVNTPTYGAIGSVIRGTLFSLHLRDFLINAPTIDNVIDLSPVGYGQPSTGGHPCTIDASDINVFASLTRIVKGYADAKMGRSRFSIMIDSSLGITNICDAEAAASTLGFLDLILRNTGNFRTKMQPLSSLFANGNTVNLCQTDHSEGVWSPTDVSGAGLTFGSISAYFVREGRRAVANFSINYPETTSTAPAKIGNLPFTAMNRPEAGAATFAFKAATGLTTGLVRASQNNVELYSEAGTPILNSALSGQTLIVSVNCMVA